MLSFNSTISSNSWGSTGFDPKKNWIYGHSNFYENILFIMAAGNERNYYDQWEYFSVCDPGGNKNVLTVGSITSLVKDNNGSVLLTDVDGDLEPISLKIMEEFFNYNLDDVFQSQELVVNTNLIITNDTNDACLYLGQCYPIIYYGESKLVCKDMEGYVFYTTNESIQQYNIDNKHIYIINERYADQSGEYEAAVYSSLGPAYKGILKPDVAAPGARVVSADSMERSSTQHGCYLNGNTFNVDSGTSMATPNVAGAAALVSQFFKEKKNYYLSGTLLRALMIASASLPDGSKQPNLLIGHGIIDLSTILCFDDSFGVAISDNNTYIEHSKHLMTKIKVNNNNSQFRIVMSYLDVELNIESMIPIVHDLDLVVISPNKKRYLGNHRKDDDSEHLSTNEKVIINEDELELGEYEIHIYSNSYVKQSFSIVAVGPIEDNFNLLFDVTQECGCSECTLTGKCKCDSLHIGNHCQKEILEINDFNSKIQIESSSIQRNILCLSHYHPL
ncbi:hypothetical protein TRFO_34739 [Tritrichomonas foetus]|uniref:Peptidase S8/S53 domain-containing protein n=1 Tax=Tritrichomonas foetus TaxID=1144522 RepID=A0A1J4JID8_9EUKA|nr:hypothetical protein TRFO_34739 [Tritrichomonas foetus]|eukprot:OHS98906.1 hypothetical protein TRFO_34739 [Tritrichomonas foetus]